ncbi:MAG TPA: NAD(+) synthase [Cyanobacteria bacterium UBA11149]|nr:NAD(+) synthase [Cyanobacteria bacterium UBA11367]HBE59640.1 NAD(+) synthase [Cyanobacteria bacterium UBA11366]HBR77090.1 NAD(+) synthase [Cyanobacteria bacterium UBA11159]HBS69058.1 NAD(+) synthase [Cyanobacteria bacterium UBA11153]HBW88473.1 NAD(+) synthase [Cyanobacteria bacterium UBA11149]HCA94799.1 NAD(+) synthase [Cyanobacteria bacterium UBA9226]
MNNSVTEVSTPFNKNSLDLDVAKETERIVEVLRQSVHQTLRRQGAVLGISGGIDSSVVLALCAKAFGAERVVALLLPEGESSPDSASLAQLVADHYGVQTITEDISGALEGFGCYQRRNEAIARLFPDFGEGWSAKIALPGSLLEKETLNIFSLTVTNPAGEEFTKRLPPREYYQIVAASNFKQRSRMAMLYYHAELRNYAVIGTPNKNEHLLGFFVKHGDGGIDVSPIGHLFKTQVYQLARYLDVPAEIQKRTPTSDTYPGGSSQEEFFFRLPFDILDTIWFGYDRNVPNDEIAQALDLSVEQVERVVSDIVRKQRTTAYLRMPAIGIVDN